MIMANNIFKDLNFWFEKSALFGTLYLRLFDGPWQSQLIYSFQLDKSRNYNHCFFGIDDFLFLWS